MTTKTKTKEETDAQTVNIAPVDIAIKTEPAVTTLTASAPKVAEAPVEKDTDPVKLKVKVGTLGFEGGVFQRGEVFTVTRARAKLFDPKDVTPVI